MWKRALGSMREEVFEEKISIGEDEVETGRLWKEGALDRKSWEIWWREEITPRLLLPMAGVILKRGLLRRPGAFGDFVRGFACCRLDAAPLGGQRVARGPMPLPALEETPEGRLLREAEEMGFVMEDFSCGSKTELDAGMETGMRQKMMRTQR